MAGDAAVRYLQGYTNYGYDGFPEKEKGLTDQEESSYGLCDMTRASFRLEWLAFGY